MKEQTNPNFHWPFPKDEPYGLFFSYCFWIINILQVAGIALTISILQEINIAISESSYQLAAINIGIGGGFLIVRVFCAIRIYLKNEYKKEEEVKRLTRNDR